MNAAKLTRHKEKLTRAMHTAHMRFRHLIIAGYWRGHHIHSPFVFHIVRDVITPRKPQDQAIRAKAAAYRRRLYESKEAIVTSQMGAAPEGPKERRVADIARRTSTREKYGRMIARLIVDLRIDSILELGTSLGVSTAYMAAARDSAQIVTIEGLPAVARLAEENLTSAGFKNVRVITGDITEQIDDAIDALPGKMVGLAFIDGDHSKEATLRFFEKIAARHAPMSVLVFDDIYWSKGMTEAWRLIVADERVSTTIELAQMGLAFFRTGCQKEHYVLRW